MPAVRVRSVTMPVPALMLLVASTMFTLSAVIVMAALVPEVMAPEFCSCTAARVGRAGPLDQHRPAARRDSRIHADDVDAEVVAPVPAELPPWPMTVTVAPLPVPALVITPPDRTKTP